MTMTLSNCPHSPEIVLGEREYRRLVTAALTAVTPDADPIDFLLFELDRAKVIADEILPTDIVRLNSIVRYRAVGGQERTVKLVMPEETSWDTGYRLSATSMHGAALLGLRPGQTLFWLTPDGVTGGVEVIKVANTFVGPGR